MTKKKKYVERFIDDVVEDFKKNPREHPNLSQVRALVDRVLGDGEAYIDKDFQIVDKNSDEACTRITLNIVRLAMMKMYLEGDHLNLDDLGEDCPEKGDAE